MAKPPSDSGYQGQEEDSFHRKGLSLTDVDVAHLFTAYLADQYMLVSVDKLEFLARGFNNKVYDVSVSVRRVPQEDGGAADPIPLRLCLRLTGTTTWPPQKFLYEVAAIRFVSKLLPSIPIPKLLFVCDRNPDISTAWCCLGMEWIEGTLLTDRTYNRLGDGAKQQIAHDIASAIAALNSLQFSSIGAIASFNATSMEDHDLGNLEQHIGPFLGETDATDGPFVSTSQHILDTFAKYSTRNVKFVEEKYQAVAPLLPYASRVKAVIEHFSDDLDNCPVCCVHGDLCGRNILMDPSTGHMRALLDWEWLGARASAIEWRNGFDDVPSELKFAVASEAIRMGVPDVPDPTIFAETKSENLTDHPVRVLESLLDKLSPWEVMAHCGNDYPVPSLEKIVQEATDGLDELLLKLELLLSSPTREGMTRASDPA